MKLAYVTKSNWGENSPGFIFSYCQAYGIAENNIDVTLIIQGSKNTDLKKSPLKNKIPDLFSVKLFSNNIGILKANEILYKRINNFILANDFEAVFTRDPGYLPFLVYLKNKANLKIYYQSHNFYMDFNVHEYKQSTNRKKFQKYEKKYINKLDGLLTLNNPQKELYQKYVDIEVFNCPPGLNIPNDTKVSLNNKKIIYCGSFQEIKGIKEIINIWKEAKLLNWNLLLIGGRNLKEIDYVKKLVNKTNLKNITIKKWVDYKKLTHEIGESSIGLIYLTNEFYNRYLTAPSKLFDYMAHGLPVVCTGMPSIQDLLPTNHKGVRLITGNKISYYKKELLELSNNQDLYQKAMESNLELSTKVTWKKMSHKISKIIKNETK